MYIFKNALRSISRAKGRNILIGIIVLVIAVSSCVALSIRESANQVKEEELEGLEITASISINTESLMADFNENNSSTSGSTKGGFDHSAFKEAMNGTSSLSLEEMLTYSTLSSVKSFYYTMTASFDETDDFLSYDTTDTEDVSETSDTEESDNESEEAAEDSTANGNFKDNPMQGGGGMSMSLGDFTVIGYSSDSAMTDFTDGTSTITDGTMFDEGTSDMVCVISNELAIYNSIAVGDTITLCNPNDDEELYTLTVVGIYKNTLSSVTSSTIMSGFSASNNLENYIYTSYNTLSQITTESSTNATSETDETTGRTTTTALSSRLAGTYVFASAENFETFEEQARTAGLSDDYTITSANLTAFENSIKPLENLSQISLYFLLVVFLIGGIILIVLNIFNIRERKYEIGVLTAIGMKKSKVALQFITEIFAVTLISITIGACVGASISVPVTNKLLESQIESVEETTSTQTKSFGREMGGGNMAAPNMDTNAAQAPAVNATVVPDTLDYYDTISSATDWIVILKLFAIGIALTLVASCAAVTFIMRYEPLKILSNRD